MDRFISVDENEEEEREREREEKIIGINVFFE